MFCTNCGTKVVEGSAHCTSCGTRVEGVGAAAAIVSGVAMSAYASMDADFKKSLFLGGGSLFASILSIVLAVPAGFLLILLFPAAFILGIMGLNAGRDLANKAGYYLGMIGLTSTTIIFYIYLMAVAAAQMGQAMKERVLGGALFFDACCVIAD